MSCTVSSLLPSPSPSQFSRLLPLFSLLNLPWLLLLLRTIFTPYIPRFELHFPSRSYCGVFVHVSINKDTKHRSSHSLTIVLDKMPIYYYYTLLSHPSFCELVICCCGVCKRRFRIIKLCLDSWQTGNAFLSFSAINYSAAALAQ